MSSDWLSAPPACEEGPLAEIDTSVAHIARVYDYWLGGKDNFSADRESGERGRRRHPCVHVSGVENRGFLPAPYDTWPGGGIRQFLDIGTGLPGAINIHEVAQAVDPTARFCTSTTTRSCSRMPARC